MRKVIGIGETILDVIFKNDQPIGAVPGGSMFNGLISLGRAGMEAGFISETGNDRIGRNIIKFMEANHVDASNISVYPEAKSPVSLAFLNDQNDAEYIFYKDHPHDKFLEHAQRQGAILYYDVNFRASHANEVMKVTPNILENLEFADIVRGSKEDFEVMFNKSDADTVYRSQISFYCKNFIYTQGAEPLVLRGVGGFSKEYPVVQTETVSTIGAG